MPPDLETSRKASTEWRAKLAGFAQFDYRQPASASLVAVPNKIKIFTRQIAFGPFVGRLSKLMNTLSLINFC